MKVTIATSITVPSGCARVGNVYPVKGGRGLRHGHMMVLIAVTKANDCQCRDHRAETGLMLTIDKDGNPVGVTQYGMHYLDEQSPIAFVEGLDNIELTMRSL